MSHYPPDAKWYELARGGIIPQAGNAQEYPVGGWRNEHPVRNKECCIDCLFCWVYCPDNAVYIENESVKGLGFSPDHCKGCSICARVCPKGCITMAPGSEFTEEQLSSREEA